MSYTRTIIHKRYCIETLAYFLIYFFCLLLLLLLSHHLRSSRCPPPPATLRAHSASWPHPQRSTGNDVRSLVGCHPKETLHCCRVTSVVSSSACSDSTYAGHHLLCPLLTTMLATSRSQTEWASPPESRPPLCPSTNPLMWTLTLRALIELPQARKEGGTPRLRPPREHMA